MGGKLVKEVVFPSYHVVLLGLDNSGKTTILYRLKYQMFSQHRSTIGFNCETIFKKGKNYNIWDVGGKENTRSLWRSYCRQSDLILFVVDSEDEERLEEARLELEMIVKVIGRNVPVLILANKQDLPGSPSVASISRILGSNSKNNWTIKGCCAVTGEGLENVLFAAGDLISKNNEKQKKSMKVSRSQGFIAQIGIAQNQRLVRGGGRWKV